MIHKLLFNLNLRSSYVRNLWKTRFHIPLKVHGIKIQAWKVSGRIRNKLIGGTYELEEVSTLNKIIEQDDKVLELGTGIGVTGSLAARLAFRGKVWTFEANPQVQKIAEIHFCLNKLNNIKLYNGIVGKINGKSDFYMTNEFWSSSRIPKDGSQRISVKVFSMNEILNDLRPTKVIADIEGSEYELFLDKAWALSNIKALCIEFHQFTNPSVQVKKLTKINEDWKFNIELHRAIELLKTQHLTIILTRP